MRVSLKWLKEYLDIVVSPEELARLLTMAGSEVKSVETIGAGWQNVVVGQVLAINPHPNADRLRLATVDIGTDKPTVVCGAPNLKVGDKVAFASVGAELLDGHTGQKARLKPAKIRGVESKGMVCSEKELGISENHEGIIVLAPDAPIGIPLVDLVGDSIIDLDITPNRPDCLSIIGIARESAALTGQTVRVPEPKYESTGSPVEGLISVEIQAPDLCPRYCASLVSDVKIGPSPKWMQERLLASGMRPINNVVDITNYVMLEYGQPLHAFDYNRLNSKKIIVRRAGETERIISLDGSERQLNSRMLVIADLEVPVAVAGVMGGANSEVTDVTRDVLLEAASFSPISIHNTGDALHLASEARYRFERGIAPELTVPALKRATQLFVELCGGQAAKGYIDLYPGRRTSGAIVLSFGKMSQLLGVEFSRDRILTTLTLLGFDWQKTESEGEIKVTAPYWRSDIHLSEDLVEEVARIIGYDQIPNTLLSEQLPHQNPDPMVNFKWDVRTGLTDFGFNEVLNFSLIGMDMIKKLQPEPHVPDPMPLRVANPMTADMEYLRLNLRSNLLSAFASNRKHEDGSIRLFELGKVYVPRLHKLPDERETVCAVMGGLRFEKSWQDNDKLLDFFDAKGTAESLTERLGLEATFEKGWDESLHPNKQALVLVEGKQVGIVGEIHPRVLAAFEIVEAVYLVEIDLKSLLPFTIDRRRCQPVPKFPSVVRDMAFIVNQDISYEAVNSVLRNFSLVDQVDIFDVYFGEQVAPGKKSLAYRISFRSPNHTLVDEEVNKIQEQIVIQMADKLGAVLRG
jgi:phenylalanyl-tRNA synthetase beta chain